MSRTESSADVQREAEAERAKLEQTLDRLRENLRPANMVEEVMAGSRVDTHDITDRVWKAARSNPIPSALIGIGAAMLLGVGKTVGFRKPAKRPEWTKEGYRPPQAERLPRPVPAALGRPASITSAPGTKASASAARVADSVKRLKADATRKADKNPQPARAGLLRSNRKDSAMSHYSRSTNQITSAISNLLDEQPLVLAALGIAVGAAIGAAIPTTDTEGRFMGDASGSVKRSAQELANDQLDHLKAKAGETFADLKQTVADHGVSSENLSGLIQDVKVKVKDAANDVATHPADAAPKA